MENDEQKKLIGGVDTEALSDEDVFVLSLANPELFGVIFDRYEAILIGKARQILQDEDDAKDAVQEAFVRMYSAAKSFRKLEGASFKSWAYKILINQCFTMYKKKTKIQRSSVVLDEEMAGSIPDTQEMLAYESRLTKDYIMSLISRLPAMLSRVVHLHFLEGVPQKQIAVMEGVSNETVRARIHRAKAELRKMRNSFKI